jgi:uncharacterized protein (TIRG00374 family)
VSRPPRERFDFRGRLTARTALLGAAATLIVAIGLWRAASSFDLAAVRASIGAADGALLLAALLASAATYPLRGARWRTLLSLAGLRISGRAATEILTLSFWVNVLLPAKLGDLYRAWLLRANGAANFGSAMGSVVAERLVDLATVALLGAASALVAVGGAHTGAVLALASLALVVAALALALLLAARGTGDALLRHLPIPSRLRETIAAGLDTLRAGSGGIAVVRTTPYTLAIWLLEALRLGVVATALGLFQVAPEAGAIGISATLFTALVAAVLTTVPFTPAGLGIVEAGTVGILVGIFGLRAESAIALALLDRAVNVGSLLLGGGLLFAVSPYRRGRGRLR